MFEGEKVQVIFELKENYPFKSPNIFINLENKEIKKYINNKIINWHPTIYIVTLI